MAICFRVMIQVNAPKNGQKILFLYLENITSQNANDKLFYTTYNNHNFNFFNFHEK